MPLFRAIQQPANKRGIERECDVHISSSITGNKHRKKGKAYDIKYIFE